MLGLRINSNFFLEEHWLFGLYNTDDLYFL
jgi:hypothetical protein